MLIPPKNFYALLNLNYDKLNLINNPNELRNFSFILDVENIERTESDFHDKSFFILVKLYENVINSNDFNFCRCPNCKNKNCLKFHKFYERNIIFNFKGYVMSAKIKIATLECTFCKENKTKTQHYHALLPSFIFPYHSYSANIIVNTLNDRFVDKLKLELILERRRISHQLYYNWINGFQKYSISASIIIGINNNIIELIKLIKEDLNNFIFQFYQKYFHPFFLFRLTCVPLAIMP